ncbi:MAG: hypothetical protein JWP01_2425 [Myxococcales bacterium]|nr:hypothetical protein [Myxococcales bacterium]
MTRALIACALLTAACSKNPAPAAPAEPAPATPAEPTGTPAEPATPAVPAAPAAENKCTQSGGRCGNKLAMNVCSRFEEAPEWGCATGEGCCMPK